MRTIITCTGYGTTGSSAATNIIEEFKDIKSLGSEFECSFLHETDGLKDLENALREGHRLKTDLAIKRFLRLAAIQNKQRAVQKYFNGNFVRHAEDFIASISTANWNGNWHRGADTIKYSKDELLYYNLAKQVFLQEYSYACYSLFEPDTWHPTYHKRNRSYYAYFDSSFYEKAQKYVNKLLSEISAHINAKKILIDQFFPAYDISSYLHYAPETRIIIVDRDPRDMYVLNKSSWGESYIPSNDIDTFINWYRGIRFSQPHELQNSNVLFFHFEDFIFNYEESLLRLKTFLNFTDEEHIKKYEYFNPEKSIKNTYKFKNYPQWKNDIKKIESTLSEFCYNFPSDINTSLCIARTEPIEEYIKSADIIQFSKFLPLKYKKKIPIFLFGMTKFGSAIESLSHRNNLKTTVKGLIKCGIFLFTFLIEYIYAGLIYLKYKEIK
ncbi:MAG: hypothetical protein ACTTKD_07935 [Peptoanaerobacter stomatis]|uniref:hypothetical protein n=1 Tax=Peptoanaerobacter stomatis TaxID=796937 RepID=UPI003F9F0565